jgi:hypothetical protein
VSESSRYAGLYAAPSATAISGPLYLLVVQMREGKEATHGTAHTRPHRSETNPNQRDETATRGLHVEVALRDRARRGSTRPRTNSIDMPYVISHSVHTDLEWRAGIVTRM